MFELKKENLVTSGISFDIIKDYKELMYYDRPILYSGKIVGDMQVVEVIADDNPKAGWDIFFCIPVTNTGYKLFISEKITLRDLIEEASSIYVKKNIWETEKTEVYRIKPSDIPEKYMPTKDSYIDTEDAEG